MGKVTRRRVKKSDDGLNVFGGVQSVIAANVGQPGQRQKVSRSSRVEVVQRDGETTVTESYSEDD